MSRLFHHPKYHSIGFHRILHHLRSIALIPLTRRHPKLNHLFDYQLPQIDLVLLRRFHHQNFELLLHFVCLLVNLLQESMVLPNLPSSSRLVNPLPRSSRLVDPINWHHQSVMPFHLRCLKSLTNHHLHLHLHHFLNHLLIHLFNHQLFLGLSIDLHLFYL